MTTERVRGPYLRGRLHMAGVDDTTPLSTALDVLTAVLMDTPDKALEKWRKDLDLAVLRAQAKAGKLDRENWGLHPEQVAATQRLMQRR